MTRTEKEIIGARHGVSAKMVTKWIARGMPNDPAKADEWIKLNRGVARGSRGGGRRSQAQVAAEAAMIEDAAKAGTAITSPEQVEGLCARCLRDIAEQDPSISGLTSAAMTRLLNLTRIKRVQLDTDRDAGELVSAEDIERTWSETLVRMRSILDGQPARIARDVAVAMGLASAVEVDLRNKLTAGIEQAYAVLVSG